jgi:hypothetical protein
VETMGILAVVIALCWFFFKPGNIGFWRLARKHPYDFYAFIKLHTHWYCGYKPKDWDVVGPFMLYIPLLRSSTKIYCDEEHLRASQGEFRRHIEERYG